MHISRLEFVARHIEHHLVGELLLDRDADGLREVGLAETGAAEDEERVENRLAGGGGDVLTGGHAHLVALALDEVGEAVDGIEARIDLDLVQARIDERAGMGGRGRVDGHLGIHRGGGPLAGETHLRLVGHGADHVAQLGVLADHALERLAEDVQEGGFDVFLEEERRDLDGQFGVLQGDGADRAEPHLELLGLDVLRDDAQTVVPYLNMSLL